MRLVVDREKDTFGEWRGWEFRDGALTWWGEDKTPEEMTEMIKQLRLYPRMITAIKNALEHLSERDAGRRPSDVQTELAAILREAGE